MEVINIAGALAKSRRLRATPDGRVRCWPRHWATLTFSMSGASCASTLSTTNRARFARWSWFPASWRRCVLSLRTRRIMSCTVYTIEYRPRMNALAAARCACSWPCRRSASCQRINRAAPAGEHQHLLGVELTARDLEDFSTECPSVTKNTRLPDWKHSDRMTLAAAAAIPSRAIRDVDDAATR